MRIKIWLPYAFLWFSWLSSTEGNERGSPDQANITAMDAVVDVNTKEEDSLRGKSHITDDIIFPKIPSSSGSQDYSAAMRFQRNLWPDGLIYYKMQKKILNLPNHVKVIKEAMAEWERLTCIRFINKTNEPLREYVYIYYGKGCRGSVGRWKGSRSILSLGKWCDQFKVVLHELGHTIGYFHEQNRPDRNKHVEILWKNINPKWQWAFYRKGGFVDSRGVPYDYHSVMHYGAKTFSINDKITIRSRDSSVKFLGNSGLSLLDIKQTNILYNCVDFPKFPEDFFFPKGDRRQSKHCIEMNEPNDPSWNDTNICYREDKKNITLKWSYSGPVHSMNCTNTVMPHGKAYARFWQDNYLCVPRDSVLRFDWSISRPITGMHCTGIKGGLHIYYLCAVRTDNSQKKANCNVDQSSNYSFWSPWQPCDNDCGGGTQSRFRNCKQGRLCIKETWQTRPCNTQRCSSWPKWPTDFSFNIGHSRLSQTCVMVYERTKFSQWINNKFCWSIVRRRNLKVRWSDIGEVPDMRCTHITEPQETQNSGWDDNFLCTPMDTPYRFRWSSNGPIKGLQCVQWNGKKGKDGWDDNYLCDKEYPEKTGCPMDWVVNRTKTDDFCYLKVNTRRTWQLAHLDCKRRNANLLSLRSEEESKFVLDNVLEGNDAWIGLNDKAKEGRWQWTDREKVTFTNWAKKEPNGGEGQNNEDCALIRGQSAVWNDFPCGIHVYYVCKKVVPRV